MKRVEALLCCICLLSSVARGGEEEYLYFYGDIHSHTGFSDGPPDSTPADAYDHARDEAGLDFYCVTDHFCPEDPEWGMQPDEYEQMKVEAGAANQDGVFVTLYGYEWTVGETHANVFTAADFIRDDTIETFYSGLFDRRLADGGINVFGKFNHPAKEVDSDWDEWAFSSKGAWCMRLMEVRGDFPPASNRAYLTGEIREYAEAIENGWLVGVDGSKDTHDDTWGEFGVAYWEKFNTVALATSLTREEIIDALQMRRTYVSQDTDFQTNPLEVELCASKDGGMTYPYIMGEALDAEGISQIDLRLTAQEGETDYLEGVSIYKNGTAVKTETGIHGLDHAMTYTDTSPAHGDYYFAFVIEEDGEAALTSAIFVRNGDTDSDGLSDEVEINDTGTNPNYHDTDGDGYGDGIEIAAGTDPLDPNDYPTPPTPTLTVTPSITPTATPAPCIDLRVSSSTVENGDRFTVDVLFNDAIYQPSAGYCVIVLPDDSCFSFVGYNEIVKGVVPWVGSVPAIPAGYTARLVDLILEGAAAAEYKLIVGVTPEHAPPDVDLAICESRKKVMVSR